MFIAVNYHYVRPSFTAKYPGICGITPAQFRSQLCELGRHGTFISPLDLKRRIIDDAPLPAKAILITFDDGLKEQYEAAYPLLNELGIPGLFFVITKNMMEQTVATVHKIHLLRTIMPLADLISAVMKEARILGCTAVELTEEEKDIAHRHYSFETPEVAEMKYYLNFKFNNAQQENIIHNIFSRYFNESEVFKNLYFNNEQLQELGERGYLGSHGHTHAPLSQLPGEELHSDMKASFQFLLQFMSQLFAISYPYGNFESCTTRVAEAAQKAGFACGFTMEKAGVRSFSHPFLLPRFDCIDLPGLLRQSRFGSGSLFSMVPETVWFKSL